MYDQINSMAQSFEEEKAIGRLSLILDDITIATKQLANLKEESEQLSLKLKDSEFLLDELNLEKESLMIPPESVSDAPPVTEGQFFAFLNSLENQEIENNGRLEGHKQLQSDLGHQLATQTQRNTKLKAEYQLVAAQLEAEQKSFSESSNVLKNIEVELEKKTTENEFLLQQCEQLKQELDERNSELQDSILGHAEELRENYRKKVEELKSLRMESSKLRIEYEKIEKLQQTELANQRDRVTRESTVGQWRNDRSVLKNKLKNLKSKLFNEQNNLDSSVKRDNDLEQRYRNMFGENHNFGENELARKCVLALINESKSSPEKLPSAVDIKYEDDYGKELDKQIQIIKKSRAVFDQYKDTVLNSLNEELNGCSQHGYTKLLKEELAELQLQLSKIM